ncbi:MAG TPA: MBL fold metallo-hydrolase [Candidatus Polarisedimenticolaceae bacterium]|nr:MBL fold metallo-hydrolase [Candidatus Polarisedimenticolaceae bacterium]
MRLLFLGTGTAFADDGRGFQSLLIQAEPQLTMLIDAGPTVLPALRSCGADPGAIDRLFLTHLHGDHVAGWPFLLLHLAIRARRTRPFHVFGPPGTQACLEGLVALCYPEILSPLRTRFELSYRELPVAVARGLEAGDGVQLDVVPMQHHPTSIGLRFLLEGKRVAVSGDTSWCEGLEALAQGCDLFVVECSSVGAEATAHVCLDELRAGRDRLGARQVALVHLPDAVAVALARDPLPGTLATHDGMALEL